MGSVRREDTSDKELQQLIDDLRTIEDGIVSEAVEMPASEAAEFAAHAVDEIQVMVARAGRGTRGTEAFWKTLGSTMRNHVASKLAQRRREARR